MVAMLRTYTGEGTERGGLDLVLSLTPDQAEALGPDAYTIAEAVDTVLVAIAALRTGYDPSVTLEEIRSSGSMKDRPVSGGSSWHTWVLSDTTKLQALLEGVLHASIRGYADDRTSYGQLATVLGVARGTAQTRRDAVCKAAPNPAELWATGKRGPEDHPGAPVPATARSWMFPLPGYIPVDITPNRLLGQNLADLAERGKAEPYETPNDVPNMTRRALSALIPFELDERRWPRNPAGRTGRIGRNLPKWDENEAADAIVVTGHGDARKVLLIKRGDNGWWATPGGMVRDGETPHAAVLRELREETGVTLDPDTKPVVAQALYVDDHRATDHAWVCTTAHLFEVDGELDNAGQDDAVESRWWPFADTDTLAREIEAAGGTLSPGHRQLLTLADGARPIDGIMPTR
jgi:ADP-ribose pyrophosphatase